MTRVLSVKDFTLSFEGQGMTFGFEYALYTYYWPSTSLSIILKGAVREYVANTVLERMDKEGLLMSPQRIDTAVQNMERAIADARTSMTTILASDLTKDSIRKAIVSGGAITSSYYVFDPHFWDSLYESADVDADAKYVIDTVGAYKNKAREYFNEFYFGETSFMRRLLEKISDARQVPVADLEMYNGDELEKLLDGELLSLDKIADRREAFVITRDQGLRVYEGKAALDFAAQFYNGVEEASGEIVRGRKAHGTGIVIRGIARLITRDYSNLARMKLEMEAMKEGEILITQTTDPEMMPALRKAAAAVTDIGGLLSHTAIVARELNIPCVVDTKIGTQIFKDGDMVEVDADAGTVRKI